MAEPTFALPQSSVGELQRMIHAYFEADNRAKGEAVAVPDVAQLANVDPTSISRNNGFFASLGVIEGGQKKRVTEKGRRLGLAISHDDPELVASALSRIVAESDFLSKVLGAVRIRGGMDLPSLQTHIAISAGVPRNRRTTLGANALVQLLLASGRLVDEEGTLRARDPEGEDDARLDVAEGGRPDSPTTPAFESRVLRRPQPGGRPAAITINVNINVTGENIDQAAELLRRLTGLPLYDQKEDSELQ